MPAFVYCLKRKKLRTDGLIRDTVVDLLQKNRSRLRWSADVESLGRLHRRLRIGEIRFNIRY